MLKNQPWLRLAGDIMTEYEQCLMEGKDVSSYKPLCEAIAHGITTMTAAILRMRLK